MKNTLIAIIASVGLLTGACATGDRQTEPAFDFSDPRVGDKVDRICFTSGIDGFSNATDRSVILSRGLRDYLVTTRARCRDLRDAMSLGLDTFSGCMTRGDQLIGFDSVFGDNFGAGSFPCFIDEMYEWDKDAEAPAEDDTEAGTEPDGAAAGRAM